MVTNPVAKNVLYQSGFAEPGHTEYLAKLTQELTGARVQPVMMLWSPELAVVPVTIHLPLKEVPQRLTVDLLVETAPHRRPRPANALRHCAPAARRRRAQSRTPAKKVRLATRTAPSCRPRSSAWRRRVSTSAGRSLPISLFHAAARARYDAALCMYHDQALIPIKTLAFDHAVNVTLGLPFVRTSPDHGTAFDIAGTGRADPGSLVAAIHLAARLTAKAETVAAAR